MQDKLLSRQNIVKLNELLSLIVIGIAIYLLVLPLIPEASLQAQQLFVPNSQYVYQSDLAAEAGIADEQLLPLPKENMIIIPKVGIRSPIIDSPSEKALDLGTWRRPQSSSPDRGGNTVLVAHRFLNQDPVISFYHLPKVEIGDKLTVFWQQKEYTYIVTAKFEVDPTQLSIENNSTEPLLTLYTCTPLYIANKRLVIIAKPLSQPAMI
jgi:sortase A